MLNTFTHNEKNDVRLNIFINILSYACGYSVYVLCIICHCRQSTRFAAVLESQNAILAAVMLPMYKLRWLHTQDRKDKAKASLTAEFWKIALKEDQERGSSNTPKCTNSTTVDDFFIFADEDKTSATPESQTAHYFSSGAKGMDSLNEIKRGFYSNTMQPLHPVPPWRDCLLLGSSSSFQRGKGSLTRSFKSFYF